MTHPARAPFCPPARSLPGSAKSIRRLAAFAARLLLLTLCAGCGDARPPLPETAMVAILAEMHLLQAQAERAATPAGEAQDSLLAAYGVDRAAWANAVAWYAARPEFFAGIYGRVVDTLQVRQMPVAEPDAATTPQASPSPFP